MGSAVVTVASPAVRSRDAAQALAARAVRAGGNPLRMVADLLPWADGLVVLAASAVAYLMRYGTEAMTPEIPAVTLLAAILCVNLLRAGGAYRDQLNAGVVTQIARTARASASTVASVVTSPVPTSSARAWSTSCSRLIRAGRRRS